LCRCKRDDGFKVNGSYSVALNVDKLTFFNVVFYRDIIPESNGKSRNNCVVANDGGGASDGEILRGGGGIGGGCGGG
jgi:hypothetical protein